MKLSQSVKRIVCVYVKVPGIEVQDLKAWRNDRVIHCCGRH